MPLTAFKESPVSRIPTPANIATSPAASQPLLEAVEKQLGSVPNMFRLIGNSPAGLTGYLGLHGALAKGTFNAALREKLAIAVAEANGCTYCLSAHTYLGRNLAKVSDEALAAARDARSENLKTQAVLQFAVKLVRDRGHVSEADLAAFLSAGWTEAQAVEVVAHVAESTLTNYINSALGTEVDFPIVAAGALK
jgi:uncharacterized peroxidase-related enzyme